MPTQQNSLSTISIRASLNSLKVFGSPANHRLHRGPKLTTIREEVECKVRERNLFRRQEWIVGAWRIRELSIPLMSKIREPRLLLLEAYVSPKLIYRL